MLEILGTLSLLRHQAQAFNQSVMVNANTKEEQIVLKNVKVVHCS